MSPQRIVLIYIIFTSVITLIGAADLILDQLAMHNIFHTGMEVLFVIFAAGSGSYLAYGYYFDTISLNETRSALNRANREVSKWKDRHSRLISDMKNSMNDQFDRWQFSVSEKKVALHLIQGFSHKQISGLLDKSERTVRNQSLSIYKKSGMTGRSELGAFFMEDLFSLPVEEEEPEDTE